MTSVRFAACRGRTALPRDLTPVVATDVGGVIARGGIGGVTARCGLRRLRAAQRAAEIFDRARESFVELDARSPIEDAHRKRDVGTALSRIVARRRREHDRRT